MNDCLSDVDRHFELWWFMGHMSHAFHRARAKELRKYKMTPEEAAVLFAAQAIGHRATPAEISRWLLREPHSVTGIISRMAKRGLVKKVKDLERKNLVRVELTEKGQLLHLKLDKLRTVKQLISILDTSEQRRVMVLLTKLCKRLNKWLGLHKSLFPFTSPEN